MYMNPTLPATGVFFSIQAVAHSSAFLSMHIGSGPGVVGLSGMQVKPLVPLRTSRILPWSSIATIVACFEIDAGAADMALLMSAASLGPAFALWSILCSWACAATANADAIAQVATLGMGCMSESFSSSYCRT